MEQTGFDPTHMAAMLIPMMLLGMIASVVLVIPYWFIFKKAGFSPWLAVLMFVPLANIIILYVIAFSQWKVVPVPPYSVTAFQPDPNQTRF
jgi:membrane protein implicated in regulation of membrane protease activity